MKLKRFLAIVISLAMVLSIVPAFSLTASAAAPDLDALVLIEQATKNGYSFIGQTTPPDSTVGAIAWNDPRLAGTNWEGWSGAAQLYWHSESWIGVPNSLFIDGNTSKGVMYVSDAVKTGTSGKDYIVITWDSGTVDAWTDMKIIDADSNAVDTFRYRSCNAEGINPHWAYDSSWQASFTDVCGDYTYDDADSGLDSGNGIANQRTVYYMVYANNQSGTGYTASYYYKAASGTTAAWIGTKSYATGSVNGLSGIGIGNNSGVQRMFNFAIYAGNYPQASDSTTIKSALDALSVSSVTKGGNITLSATATDSIGTTVDVTWTSSKPEVIAADGTVTAPAAFTEVTLTPSATFDGAAVEGSGKKVAVFPASYAEKDMYGYYEIGTKVDTSNISWYTRRSTADAVYTVNGLTKATDNGVTIYTFPGLGGAGSTGDSTVNARTSVAITPGNSYLVRFYYGGTALGNGGGDKYNKVYTTESAYNDEVPLDYISGTETTGITTTANVWTEIQTVFTASEKAKYLTFVYSWLDPGLKVADIELYNVTNLGKTVTLKILDEDGNILIPPLKEQCLSGGSVTFEAQSFSSNGVYYTTEAKTYENVTADDEYTIFATIDTTRYASVDSYTWDYDSNSDISTTLIKGNIPEGLSDTLMTINWGSTRQGIINFNVPVTSGKQLASATLTLRIGGQQGNNVGFKVYAMPTAKSPKAAASPVSSAGVEVGSYNGTYSGEAQDAVIEVPLTFTDYVDTSAGLTLRLAATSQMGVYWGANQGDKAPVLTNVIMGDITATFVTVNCVDESGNLLHTESQYHTKFYGYDDELIYPELEIPTVENHIFKSKSVSDITVTLTYVYDTQDDYFFDNITNMNTRFVSLNMLGAHDAFTSGMTNKTDAAALKQENSVGGAYGAALAPGVALPKSKAQDKDALEMLQAGARYFDVRISRSETNSSYLSVSAKHTNGVMYTTHALLGGELRPMLYTISQWAATHPGEIIVLDFQEFYDYNSGYNGNALKQSWRDLDTLLSDTGIKNYVKIGNGSIKDVTYGDLTENKTKAGIVLFGRNVESTYGQEDYGTVGSFILRGTTKNAFQGKVYSNYDKGGASIGSSYSASYIQAQVDHMAEYQTVAGDETGDNIIHWMFRVMQSQSEGSNLVTQGAKDNTSLYSGLVANPEWLTALPVVMVNTVGTNTDNIRDLLKSCNVPSVTVNYVYNGQIVKSVPNAALVGTLYTNNGFYDEPIYKLVAGNDGEYYVTETFYTAPYNGTVTEVIKDVTIEVDVTKLGNVYTAQNGKLLTNNLTDDGAYTGKDSFGAFNWGATAADRIGIAVLSAETGSSAYMLSATEVRKYFNTDAGATKFYAIPASTYRSLDLYDASQLISYMTDANLVATVNHGNCGEAAVGNTEIILDAEKISSISASGDVVIFADSVNGLYGLKNDMQIVPCYLVESTINGVQTKTIAKPNDVYTLDTDKAKVYADGSGNLYAPGSNVTINSDMNFDGYNDLGAKTIKGAQVRIGAGVDKDGKIPAAGGSGLRFITKINGTDTIAGLANINANITEIGVRITAEGGGETYTDIPTKDWQTADSVFTSALTNIKDSNYNRTFYATPYVKYTDKVTGAEQIILDEEQKVGRSIYQVAAGLLANNSTDGTDYDQTALQSEVLYKVLNAYVNQTGIRLQINSDKTGLEIYNKADSTSNYSGDVFFEVKGTTCENDIYTITIQPIGAQTTINSYWKDYIRINNNHSKIADYTSMVDNGDNTVTITFDYASYVAANPTTAG